MIDDGQRYLAYLLAQSFDVAAAFWIKTGEEGRWFLYIATKLVDDQGLAAAYREAYGAFPKVAAASFAMFDIKLISPSNPIARDAIALRDRYAGNGVVRYPDAQLGNLFVEEVHIYPAVLGPMAPKEVLETLFAMATRPAGTLATPSLITLQNGSSLRGIITEFHLQLPGGFTIRLRDPSTNADRLIPGQDVARIQ